MTHYRYGATLRPFGQLNLNRLEACDNSQRIGWLSPRPFAFGTMLFHRKMTDFEVKQFDLTYLGEEEDDRYCE
jgi:hypothetical protein